MTNIRRRVVIHGRVQGVGFRYWTRSQADRLDVSGWVRNRSDGAVEAEVEGKPGAVSELLDALRLGPAGAVVTSVDITELRPDGEPGFSIRTGDRGGSSPWFRRG